MAWGGRTGRVGRARGPRTGRVVRVVLPAVPVVGGAGGAAAAYAGTGGVRLAGACVLVTALSFGWVLHGPRGTGRPQLVDGSTRLPRRPGYAGALALGCVGLAASALCLGVAMLGDPDSQRRAGAVWLAVPLFGGYGAWILLARLLGRGLTTLSPTGLEHTSLAGRTRRVPWRHVHDVQAPTAPGTALVIETRDGPVVWNVGGQGVPPQALGAAVRCFAKRPQDRALLARPGALDRWLGPGSW